MDNEEINYFNYEHIPGKMLKRNTAKEMVKSKIEIIISPESNKENNIQEMINSIINQTFPFWKLNIINNELKEETIEKIRFIDDSRINIINESSKIDLIKNSECKYICMIHSEDVIDETFIECAYWSLETNKDASWCYSNFVINKEELKNENFYSEEERNRNIVSSSYIIRKEELVQLIDKGCDLDNNWVIFLQLLNQNKFPVKMNFYGVWSNNVQNAKKNEEIEKIAQQIQNKIEGINYPVGVDYWFNTRPFEFEWEITNERNSNKKNLLFIVPWFKVGGADKFNYDLISNLNKEKYNITIITTEPSQYIWRQKFEEYAEIFDLTSFLHRQYWAAFIHYIIKTRNIDLVMNTNSYYGYYAIPWLKSKFPNVIFTDYLHAINWNYRNGEYPTDSTAICNILDKTFVSTNSIKKIMEEKMRKKKTKC